MKSKLTHALGLFLVCFLSLFGSFSVAEAYTITDAGAGLNGDFVLTPGKMEVFVNPGDTVTKTISITDRIAGSRTFDISTEDFVGSDQADQPVVLLGNEKSPYSFKDNIKADTDQIVMTGGQEATVPITITVPKDASPGGYYSAVIVSSSPNQSADNSGTQVITRVGVLFFVRVNGPVTSSGNLDDFRLSEGNSQFGLLQSGPLTFEILFKNTGNIYLIPSGTITIKNVFGQQVASLPVDAYFALPNSLRYRDIEWPQKFLAGVYTATLTLNDGYNSKVETKSLTFWVIPWMYIGIILLAALIIASIVYFFTRNFELKKK